MYAIRSYYDPSDINKWLKKNGGFEDAWNGNAYLGEVSLNWAALKGFGDGMVYTRFDWNAQPADLLLIRYYLEKQIPVVAEVEYRGLPHYVVLTGVITSYSIHYTKLYDFRIFIAFCISRLPCSCSLIDSEISAIIAAFCITLS